MQGALLLQSWQFLIYLLKTFFSTEIYPRQQLLCSASANYLTLAQFSNYPLLKNIQSITIPPNSVHKLIKLSPKSTLSFWVSTVPIIFQPLQIRILFNIQSEWIHDYWKAKDHILWNILIILIFFVAMYLLSCQQIHKIILQLI